MIREALSAVLAGEVLGESTMAAAMDEIMGGEVPPEVTAGLLCALAARGETVDELAGAARTMRARVTRIQLPEGPAVDTCGTGGDGSGTFNISTTAAFIVAACGVSVAKHGNRAVSSKSGSADVLEALGVDITAAPERVEACLADARIGFLFAQKLHPAMRHAAPVRRALGVRTLFNLVGPLTNPAFAPRQVMGVFDGARVADLAAVLGRLGSERAWVVHGEDGLDELTLTGATRVAELRDGSVRTFEVRPEDAGLARCAPGDLRGGDAATNAEILRSVLSGNAGPALDIALLNAGAALLVVDRAEDLRGGVELARQAVESGDALRTLERLVVLSGGP
jgi:anthranilate phosphoribosyltransferase